jgi:hypothetical protein
MKRAALLLLLLASPALAQQPPLGDDPAMTCDAYLRALNGSPHSAAEARTWAAGFYAGVASAFTAEDVAILQNPRLGGPRFADVMAHYCEKKPNRSFFDATRELLTGRP